MSDHEGHQHQTHIAHLSGSCHEYNKDEAGWAITKEALQLVNESTVTVEKEVA